MTNVMTTKHLFGSLWQSATSCENVKILYHVVVVIITTIKRVNDENLVSYFYAPINVERLRKKRKKS